MGLTKAIYSTLDYLCSEGDLNVDIIFTQEVWLTPANLYKIKYFSNRYHAYGISAIETAIASGILRGRPYGGVCTLIKSSISSKINFFKCSDRFFLFLLTILF